MSLMAQSAHFNYSLSWKEVQTVKSSPVEIVVLGIPEVLYELRREECTSPCVSDE